MGNVLIDEYALTVCPVSCWGRAAVPWRRKAGLRLVDSKARSTRGLLLTYQPA
ncbi:MAG: hypothetical protein ACRDK3_01295 [Actinomycetota bacterium]